MCNHFYMNFVFYKIYKLMLHPEVYFFLFLEVFIWIKRNVVYILKHGQLKVQVSQHPPLIHHVTFDMWKKRDQIQHVL